MVCFFPHDLIHVFGYKQEKEYDEETGELIHEYYYKYSTLVDFQLTTNHSYTVSYTVETGLLLQDVYKMFTNTNVKFLSNDLIKYKEDYYSIDGSPEMKHHLIHHNYVKLKKHHEHPVLNLPRELVII